MRDFFKPWRRKIGVVTLGLACVLTAEWLRAFRVTDDICIHTGGGTSYLQLETRRDGLAWKRFTQMTTTWRMKLNLNLGWTCRDPQHDYWRRVQLEERGLSMRSRWGGFEWKRGHDSVISGILYEVLIVPYWAIVLPLTLLSAYLLLSKPRPPTPKTTEPAPAAGT